MRSLSGWEETISPWTSIELVFVCPHPFLSLVSWLWLLGMVCQSVSDVFVSSVDMAMEQNVNTYIPFSRSSSVHRPFHSLTYLSICSLGFICRRARCFLIYVAYSFILILPVSIFALHCPSFFSMSHTSLAHVSVTPSHPTPSSHSLLSVTLPHIHNTHPRSFLPCLSCVVIIS